MYQKYINDIKNDIKKYYKNYFEFDYEKIMKICANNYLEFIKKNATLLDKECARAKTFAYILNLSNHLDKLNFKKFINIFKNNNYHKLFSNPVSKKGISSSLKLKLIILKYFPKLYFKLHLIVSGNFNFVKNKSTKKKLQYYFDSNDNIITKFKKIFFNYLELPYIELVITTKCSLKCKECANLMYKYSNPYDVDLENLKLSINKLLSCTNSIKNLRILGGEPFLNPNLAEILKELNSSKIKEITIVTNGTIIPKNIELINELQKKNITIEISDYGNLSHNKEKLINFCISNDINVYIQKFIVFWMNYGDLIKYNNNIKKQFYYCDNGCKSLLNGKIYYCPRQSHGTDLNIIKTKNDEYIDLLNNSNKENKKLLKKYLFRNIPINACNYCKYATKNCKIVETANQLRNF